MAGALALARELLAYAGHAALLPVSGGADPESPPGPGDRTVLFVHGLYAKASVLRPMREYLRRRGHERLVSFAHAGTDVERIAADLGQDVSRRIPEGRVDVVAHSLGGLAVRLWLQEMGGVARVDRCVFLGVPHAGTERARLLPVASLAALRPGSALLARLAQSADRAQAVATTSVVAEGDLMVRPVGSAGAFGQTVHRVRDLGHNGLLFSPRVLRIVDDALRR
jgi:triacylglycerol lipase